MKKSILFIIVVLFFIVPKICSAEAGDHDKAERAKNPPKQSVYHKSGSNKNKHNTKSQVDFKYPAPINLNKKYNYPTTLKKEKPVRVKTKKLGWEN